MAVRESSGSYNFKQDKEIAYHAERELGAILLSRKDIKNVVYNDNYKYDLILTTVKDTKITIEVKCDLQSSVTGNIVVEFESRGKPSGISRSEADYWFYKVEGEWWSINRLKLQEIINLEHYERVVVGGDKGSETKMYLFKKDTLLSFMKHHSDY